MEKTLLIEHLRSQIQEAESGEQKPSFSSSDPAGRAVSSTRETRDRPDESASNDNLEISQAFKKIVALVNVSDRSEQAIRERLTNEGFDELAIDQAVDRAKTYSIIDDAHFAEVLVRSRLSQGRGLSGIKRELKQHNIDVERLAFWQEGICDDSQEGELDRAIEALNKKPPRTKHLREGAYRYLVRRGYASSIASSAARIWAESQEYDH